MSEIKEIDYPSDIWDAAESAWREAYQMRRVGPANTIAPIARAIMAERWRLAVTLREIEAIAGECTSERWAAGVSEIWLKTRAALAKVDSE